MKNLQAGTSKKPILIGDLVDDFIAELKKKAENNKVKELKQRN